MATVDYEQDDRYLAFDSPAGANRLLPVAVEGEEELSRPFRIRLELVSSEPAIDFERMVGKTATLRLERGDGGERHLNGIVTRLVQRGRDARMHHYLAELRPWLWLLGRSSDCRIFQSLSVPEILAKVFGDHGQRAFRDACKRSYDKRDYCVQYNETAFAFVSRLMEEEGIFYYFEHSRTDHTLIFADDADAYAAHEGGKVRYRPGPELAWPESEVITACQLEQEVVVASYAVDDYNFETPATSLLGKVGDGASKLAVYDYPGAVASKSAAEKRARLRIEQEEATGRVLSGESLCRGFAAGTRFALEGHFRGDVNGEWVVRRVIHAGRHDSYLNTFEALPAKVPYRTPRRTPKPRIAGSQTAMVVGPTGKEIWTDKYGRIKVQFHWDREGRKDDKSSCWVRVAQSWAGKGWGAFFLPRVGQEVVVSFLDGDPDRPLVTGCVYNAQQTVPYPLPAQATKTTLRSRSSEKGEGFNELRFEDKKGEEEVFVHAEKDLLVTVKENRTQTVGKDDTLTVKNDRKATIEEGDELLTVAKGDRKVTVAKGDETHAVKGERSVSVTKKEAHDNESDYRHDVKGDYVLKVAGDLTIDVTGTVTIKSKDTITTQASLGLTNKAGTSLTNQAGTSLTNKADMSLTNDAGMSLTNKAGLGLTNKGTMHTAEASGIMTIKGSLVKVN